MKTLSWLMAALALVMGHVTNAHAEDLRPSNRVVRWVNVRQGPGTETPVVGRLEPGQSAELIEVVPSWYAIRLADGRIGYVSRAWAVRSKDTAFIAAYRLHMIDVGTGLAVFVEGPGFSLLYDAGSNDDTARLDRNRVVAYLHHARPDLTSIDHVILSHPHKDHVELLPDVLSSFDVHNAWDSGRTNPICSYRAFLRVIRDRSIAYHDADDATGPHVVDLNAKSCYGRAEPAERINIPHAEHIVAGRPISLGPGATMTFVHADASEQESFNENSLVVALDVGRTRVLFMGDAEAGGRRDPSILPSEHSVEGELLACCRTSLKSDILIVGHHGSKTSSRTAFLDAAGAYLFLVSAGPKKYATVTLPDHEVIDVLKARGTVYRTDMNDRTCPTDAGKIGPDSDNRPGGCDNVVISIDPDGEIRADYFRSAD